MQEFRRQKYWILYYGLLLILYSLLLLYLLSDGTFRLNKQYYFTQVFSDMWDQLLKGRVESNWSAIRDEAFVVGERYIAYFLPFPALVRGGLSLFGLKDSAIASQIIASLVFAFSFLGIFSILLMKICIRSAKLKRYSLAIGSLFLILCSPITIMSSYPMTYWESISWGCAIYALTLALALYLLGGPKHYFLIPIFSIVCGCNFFTRPTFGLSAMILFLFVYVISFKKYAGNKVGWFSSLSVRHLLLLSLALYFIMGAGLGILNYLKWGSPWIFQSINNYTLMWTSEQIADFLSHGNFRIDRIPESFVFYFIPSLDNFTNQIPFIKPGQNSIFEGFAAHIGYREAAIPLFLTLPIYIVLGLIGISGLLSGKEFFLSKKNLGDMRYVYIFVCAISFFPGLIMFPFYSFAVRYQGEFLVGITFCAAIGMVKIITWLDDFLGYADQHRSGNIIKVILAILVSLAICSSLFLEIAASKIQRSGWQKNAAYIKAPTAVDLGEPISFCKTCNGVQYLQGIGAKPIMGSGWAYPEDWGVWSDGNEAMITFELPDVRRPKKLILKLKGFIPAAGYRQEVQILVNGRKFQTIFLLNDQIFDIDIPLSLPKSRGQKEYKNLSIGFLVANPVSLKTLGLGEDDRELGIALIGASFQ